MLNPMNVPNDKEKGYEKVYDGQFRPFWGDAVICDASQTACDFCDAST